MTGRLRLPWPWRRRAAPVEPWPPAWRAIVERNVPLVGRLPARRRAKLERLVSTFLADKTFEGCGGLELTDEIRVTIAAQACLLLVGLEVRRPYPDLDVIRVYPAGWRRRTQRSDGLVVTEREAHHLGESGRRGYVVLSWDAARRGARDDRDGENVVLHEFAHQLDTEDGAANGAPVLGDAALYRPWAEALGAAYERLQQDVVAARRSPLDPYGATSPAEFFAVATEAFFERPERLRRERPELYEVLARYFRQDPAAERAAPAERAR